MGSSRYQFTNKAKEDLDMIINYISNNLCNPSAAKSFFEHLFDYLDNLCLFPESCPLVENEFIKRKDIRKSVIDNYILYYFYDKDDSIIFVLRIVYGKMSINEILKTFNS